MATQVVRRLVLAEGVASPYQGEEFVTLVDSDGDPVELGGGADVSGLQSQIDALEPRIEALEAGGEG